MKCGPGVASRNAEERRATRATFPSWTIIPYSIINFYTGIRNESAILQLQVCFK
jgi:hypothetical protein